MAPFVGFSDQKSIRPAIESFALHYKPSIENALYANRNRDCGLNESQNRFASQQRGESIAESRRLK
jgi:hypothetical protein